MGLMFCHGMHLLSTTIIITKMDTTHITVAKIMGTRVRRGLHTIITTIIHLAYSRSNIISQPVKNHRAK